MSLAQFLQLKRLLWQPFQLQEGAKSAVGVELGEQLLHPGDLTNAARRAGAGTPLGQALLDLAATLRG